MITGTDTYGKVKRVGGIPVATKFAMLHFLPLWPIESYYFLGNIKEEREGVPFFAETHRVTMNVIPFESLDCFSVAMAYTRGLFGALLLIGFIGTIVPGYMYLLGDHLDRFAILAVKILATCFIAGLLGGAFTYLMPLTSRRERQLRERCSELLGLCIDPARVDLDIVDSIEDILKRDVIDASADLQTQEYHLLLHELIMVRIHIARDLGVPRMKKKTNELLKKLKEYDKFH